MEVGPGSSSLPNQTPWFGQSKFGRYWRHREQLTNWFSAQSENKPGYSGQQTMSWYKSMADYHTSMARWMREMGSYYSNWYNTWLQSTSFPTQRKRARVPTPATSPTSTTPQTRKKSRKSKKSRKKHNRRNVTVRTESLPGDTESEQFQMEITEEMIEFFAQSAKHKQERDAKYKATENMSEDEHVNLGEVNVGKQKATVLPPTERPGYKRTQEMTKLYGRGAAMIHGMETAMQLNFDRNCDRQQPKHWPQLPLNIQF